MIGKLKNIGVGVLFSIQALLVPAKEQINVEHLNEFLISYYKLNFTQAKYQLTGIKNELLRNLCLDLVRVKESAGREPINLEEFSKFENTYQKTLYLLSRGYDFLYSEPYSPKAFELFNKAYALAKEESSVPLLKITIIAILDVYYEEIYKSNDECLFYLNVFKQLSSTNTDRYYHKIHTLHLVLRTVSDQDQDQLKIDNGFLRELDSLMEKFDKDHPFYADYYSSKGIVLKSNQNNELAIPYFERSIQVADSYPFLQRIGFRSSLHLSEIYAQAKDISKSLQYFEYAANRAQGSNPLRAQYYLNIYQSIILYAKEDYREAYDYLKRAIIQEKKLAFSKNALEVERLNAKYQDIEKEKQLLKSQNWIMTLSAILMLILPIGYLSFNNSRKKRLLALQEKELETQKNLRLLKEQEITTINAMVEGQEKERKRVAEDLHDNLGSVIATLKLHFDNLRINQIRKKIDQEILFDRTERLIDDAYQRVRNIAHAKNVGVMADQGLLVAIQLMAEKISSANGIQIDVVAYGLEKPLDNGLEISLFRMVQELTTNILKHAAAQRATINLSRDESDLTILVEDNGKGMETNAVQLKKGMGLHSITTRVKHLKGHCTIDTTLGKGTTVIIEIPI